MRCKNCDYIGAEKEGSFNLCPRCLMNSLVYAEKQELVDDINNFKYEPEGKEIKGSIKISNKESAIAFIQSIIESFDISKKDLNL